MRSDFTRSLQCRRRSFPPRSSWIRSSASASSSTSFSSAPASPRPSAVSRVPPRQSNQVSFRSQFLAFAFRFSLHIEFNITLELKPNTGAGSYLVFHYTPSPLTLDFNLTTVKFGPEPCDQGRVSPVPFFGFDVA